MPEIGEISQSPEGVIWIVPNVINLFQSEQHEFSSPAFSFLDKKWTLFVQKERDITGPGESQWDWVNLGISELGRNGDDFLENEYFVEFGIKDESQKVFVSREAEYDNGNYYCKHLILFKDLQSRRNEILPNGNIHFYFDIEREEDIAKSPIYPLIGPNDGIWSLKEQMKNLLQTENYADVVINVQGQEFKAHKVILQARSPVFMATFNTNENITKIEEEDADPSTFSDFLYYLYAAEIKDLSTEKAFKLYLLSNKYEVRGLKEICLEYMMKVQ